MTLLLLFSGSDFEAGEIPDVTALMLIILSSKKPGPVITSRRPAPAISGRKPEPTLTGRPAD